MNDQDLAKIDKLLQKRFKENLQEFATKNDLANFATKDDIKSFATKDDIKSFATKDDIKSLRKKIEQEIKDSATAVTKDLTKLINNFVQVIEDRKADKTQTLSLEVRTENLERKVFPQ